jgi:hypothetical protein
LSFGHNWHCTSKALRYKMRLVKQRQAPPERSPPRNTQPETQRTGTVVPRPTQRVRRVPDRTIDFLVLRKLKSRPAKSPKRFVTNSVLYQEIAERGLADVFRSGGRQSFMQLKAPLSRVQSNRIPRTLSSSSPFKYESPGHDRTARRAGQSDRYRHSLL